MADSDRVGLLHFRYRPGRNAIMNWRLLLLAPIAHNEPRPLKQTDPLTPIAIVDSLYSVHRYSQSSPQAVGGGPARRQRPSGPAPAGLPRRASIRRMTSESCQRFVRPAGRPKSGSSPRFRTSSGETLPIQASYGMFNGSSALRKEHKKHKGTRFGYFFVPFVPFVLLPGGR